MRRVFSKPAYLLLAGLITIVVFLLIIWLPDLSLASLFLSDPTISHSLALRLTWGLLSSSFANTGTLFLWYYLFTALLIGINSALLMFYIRLYRSAPSLQNVTGGVLGSVLALLGFGCVSCGSIFLATLFAAVSGTSFLAIAPYLGIGVGTAGIGLLLLSAFFLVRTINTPPVCPI